MPLRVFVIDDEEEMLGAISANPRIANRCVWFDKFAMFGSDHETPAGTRPFDASSLLAALPSPRRISIGVSSLTLEVGRSDDGQVFELQSVTDGGGNDLPLHQKLARELIADNILSLINDDVWNDDEDGEDCEDGDEDDNESSTVSLYNIASAICDRFGSGHEETIRIDTTGILTEC